MPDLGGIAFGAGPGSFTGLRIACGVAQGLALGANLPLIGVTTLEAMAETARSRSGCTRVIAALDARMHEVYLAAYEHNGSRWCAHVAPSVVAPSEAPLPTGENWCGVGTALPHFRRCANAWPGRWRRAMRAFYRRQLRSASSPCRDSRQGRGFLRAMRRRCTCAIALR